MSNANKNLLIGAAILGLVLYLVSKLAKQQEQQAPLGYFIDWDGIYNPNGGPSSLYTYTGSTNGGYGGPLGNLADGNPYSAGL